MGISVSVALIVKDGKSFGGAIIRELPAGRRSIVGSVIPKTDFFDEMTAFLNSVKAKCTDLGVQIDRVYSSFAYMRWLDERFFDEVPWNFLYKQRSFLLGWKGSRFHKVCPTANGGAVAIAFAVANGFNLDAPPAFVKVALNADSHVSLLCLANFCDHKHAQVSSELRSQDDGVCPNPRRIHLDSSWQDRRCDPLSHAEVLFPLVADRRPPREPD